MNFLVLKIRNGGFFVGPKHWLIDAGSYYDFELGFVRRRIFKNSIDSYYEFSTPSAFLIIPVLVAVLTARYSISVLIMIVRFMMRTFFRF